MFRLNLWSVRRLLVLFVTLPVGLFVFDTVGFAGAGWKLCCQPLNLPAHLQTRGEAAGPEHARAVLRLDYLFRVVALERRSTS